MRLYFSINVANLIFSLVNDEATGENVFKIEAYHKEFVDKEIKECFAKAVKYVADRHIPIKAEAIKKVFDISTATMTQPGFPTDRVRFIGSKDVNVCVQNDAGRYTLWLRSGFMTSWDQLPINADPTNDTLNKAIDEFNARLARNLNNELDKLKDLEKKATDLIKRLIDFNEENLYKEA